VNYPFWESSVSYGILMAGIAVFHVFISHFAIGGGLFLIVNEMSARKSGDKPRLDFLKHLSRFFVLVTVVTGALTGVGIWFVIGLLNPAATELLIHNFVWAWAIEWTFFAVEILAAILYLYGWTRMRPRDHMIIGWIYFGSAWLSLFVINGILTFMLTPGTWIATGDFWSGLFNPTFWQSLILRTGVCLMLAGLYALMVASVKTVGEVKSRVVRQSAVWGILGLAITVPALHWYWTSIPASVTTAAMAGMPIPLLALRMSFWFASGLACSLILFGLVFPKMQHAAVAVVTLAAALGWFGSFEWFRESIRKPFIISGYMYGNGLTVAQAASMQNAGLLSAMPYRTGNDGADLFRRACGNCHTLRGYNGLNRVFAGTDRQFIASMAKTTILLKGNMPPFAGNTTEADAIGRYLEENLDRQRTELAGLTGAVLGRKVYEVRCGACHITGKSGDKTASLTGLSEDDYRNILENASDLGAGMPAFTAGQAERDALIAYFKTLKGGTK
jgi:mono/diheme cytochrome c family protein